MNNHSIVFRVRKNSQLLDGITKKRKNLWAVTIYDEKKTYSVIYMERLNRSFEK